MLTQPIDVKKIGSRLLAVILVLAFLGASLPAGAARAQSSSDCQETYTVKSGDWLVKIAANYEGISWSDIATANNIKGPSYTIFVGQRLCIPKRGTTGTGSTGGTTGGTGTGARITFERKSNNRLTVTVTNAQARAFYFVRVDDTKQSRLEWFRIGTLRTNADREGEATFNLPDELSQARDFNVCLKNTITDDLLCNNPRLTRLTGKSTGGTTDSTRFTGTFKVSRSGSRLIIETSGFPKNSFYNVRVAEIKAGMPVFTKIGTLRTGSDTSGTYRYDLTSSQERARTLRVCLKNTETDAVSCVDSIR